MLDFRRVVKNRKIQPEAAFCPTKNQGLEWMNSNPRMQIAFTSPRQSPDLWLQSMTSKATTTYLAWQTGGDHL
jgi:hypothetical protein